MGHLCFDWSVPSDHMLEKAKAGAGFKGLSFPEEPHPLGVGTNTSTQDRDHFLPATEPASP